MAGKQKAVEAPKVETPPPPMTEEQFLDEGADLIKRGKAAGLNTTALGFRLGFREGSGWLETVLGAIQSGNGKTGKK